LTTYPQMKLRQEAEASSRHARSSRLLWTIGEAACVVSLGSAFAFGALYALRSGSGDSVTAVVSLMAQSVLPVLVGLAAMSLAFTSAERRNVAVAATTISSLLAPCVAVYSRPIAIMLMAGMATCSVVLLWRHRSGLRRITFGPMVLKAGIFAGLLIVSTDATRIFIPEQMSLGIATSDSLFHAAIAQMIAHYGQVATGADGLFYQQYYFLSHAVAAGLAKLTSANVPLVYVYWGAVSLKVQLIWAISIASVLIEDEHRERGPGIMTRLAFACLVAVLTRALESESFVLGMAVFLTLLPVLCGLVQRQSNAPIVALSVAMIGALICAATKASVGFFAAVALLGAVWRLKQFPATRAGIVAGLFLLGFVTLRYLSPADTLLLDAGWRVLLTSYGQYIDGIAVLSFAAPLFLLLVAARRPRVFRSQSATAMEWRIEIDAAPAMRRHGFLARAATWLLDESSGPTFVLGLSLVACISVLFMVPIGSNVAYFSLVLLMMAAVMAPSILRPLFNLGIERKNTQRAIFGSVAVILCAMTAQFSWNTKNAVSALYRSAFSATSDYSIGGLVLASLQSHHSLLAAVRQQSLNTTWSRLKRDILSRSADDAGLVVHTPPDVDEFWTRLSSGTPWWCIASHLMIPAELGIVQIRNIAPRSIETRCVSDGIAFYGFGKTQDLHRTAVLSDSELCAMVQESKFGRVYVINSLSDLSRNRVLSCR
jgi:hypothetical protein